MICTEIEGAVVCREEMREVRREPNGEPRWCFMCRTVQPFVFVVTAPVGPSYYGPNPSIQCAACAANDGDLFPGREREWEELP